MEYLSVHLTDLQFTQIEMAKTIIDTITKGVIPKSKRKVK